MPPIIGDTPLPSSIYNNTGTNSNVSANAGNPGNLYSNMQGPNTCEPPGMNGPAMNNIPPAGGANMSGPNNAMPGNLNSNMNGPPGQGPATGAGQPGMDSNESGPQGEILISHSSFLSISYQRFYKHFFFVNSFSLITPWKWWQTIICVAR